MLSIQTHGKIDDPNRYTFGDCRVYMRTTDQMLEMFKDHPKMLFGMLAKLPICVILILKLINSFSQNLKSHKNIRKKPFLNICAKKAYKN